MRVHASCGSSPGGRRARVGRSATSQLRDVCSAEAGASKAAGPRISRPLRASWPATPTCAGGALPGRDLALRRVLAVHHVRCCRPAVHSDAGAHGFKLGPRLLNHHVGARAAWPAALLRLRPIAQLPDRLLRAPRRTQTGRLWRALLRPPGAAPARRPLRRTGARLRAEGPLHRATAPPPARRAERGSRRQPCVRTGHAGRALARLSPNAARAACVRTRRTRSASASASSYARSPAAGAG